MQTLRLIQSHTSSLKMRVELELKGRGQPRTATSEFNFELSETEREQICWYMEDFLSYPSAVEQEVSCHIEEQLRAIGLRLFKLVFAQDENCRKLYAEVRRGIADTRFEICTDLAGATVIPWELLWDPITDRPLALEAAAFVRTHRTKTPHKPTFSKARGSTRVLWVISRPGGGHDVGFRSIASRLLPVLVKAGVFSVDVLRPPTFDELARTLRQAKAKGAPYHVVHFDGHGFYGSLGSELPLTATDGPQSDLRGYVVFEDPGRPENERYIDGNRLGRLLVETGVFALILNACQSAFGDPKLALDRGRVAEGTERAYSLVRAIGSFAQEVVHAGVPGVVAMRYTVYVSTAMIFMAEMYEALGRGCRLGEAVSLGRKHLDSQPVRSSAFGEVRFQDWSVPIIYELEPLSLCSRHSEQPPQPSVYLDLLQLDTNLPGRPESGFIGRDETILALDRAFDIRDEHNRAPVVLLFGMAGSGKTSTAAEFARWYKLTGGVSGPIIYTSFERHKPLAAVLDDFERVLRHELERRGKSWSAMNAEARRMMALELLQQTPILWIWDNIELVAGFPTGVSSNWTDAEQGELFRFLSDSHGGLTKFLLVSRRDEQQWLGELPFRTTIRPMGLDDSIGLVSSICVGHGVHVVYEDWAPLIQYADGNPLTITVLTKHVLRHKLHKEKNDIRRLIGQLKSGEVDLFEGENQGRSKSLTASLEYGLRSNFTAEELGVLARVHLFQGHLQLGTLALMVNKADNPSEQLDDLSEEHPVVVWVQSILDKAVDIGLLRSRGNYGYYVHPALPWHFAKIFEQLYSEEQRREEEHAFVLAVGWGAGVYASQSHKGETDILPLLEAEEGNLLNAKELAIANGWFEGLSLIVCALEELYDKTVRVWEWIQLVDEITTLTLDSTGHEPREGHEILWSLVIEYQVSLALRERRWTDAETWARKGVEYHRCHAQKALNRPPDSWDELEAESVQNLASSLHFLGQVLREMGKAQCIDAYREMSGLCHLLGDKQGLAISLLNTGNALSDLPVEDYDQAEACYLKAASLFPTKDMVGKCLSNIGQIALERFAKLLTPDVVDGEDAIVWHPVAQTHLERAVEFLERALHLLPSNCVEDRAITHGRLGVCCEYMSEPRSALAHYREAIRLNEIQGDQYSKAINQRRAASLLARQERLSEALVFARESLRLLETIREVPSDVIAGGEDLVAQIESDLRAGRRRP